MARYRFHCTNGSECVFDAAGADVRVPGRLRDRAQGVAAALMREGGGRTDWSGWRVTVHDLTGRRVLVEPFVAGNASALAA